MTSKENIATYSYTTIYDCAAKVKAIDKTVTKKIFHHNKALEIKAMYDYCFEKTGCWTFASDIGPAWDYYIAAENYKIYTKKDLDSFERRALIYLYDEINGIYDLMIKGEVNTIA